MADRLLCPPQRARATSQEAAWSAVFSSVPLSTPGLAWCCVVPHGVAWRGMVRRYSGQLDQASTGDQFGVKDLGDGTFDIVEP